MYFTILFKVLVVYHEDLVYYVIYQLFGVGQESSEISMYVKLRRLIPQGRTKDYLF